MKYHFRIKPRPHQRRALKFLLRHGGGGLQVPMRFGKTKVAIDFAYCLNLQGKCDRVLVVCPKSVIGVWREEIKANRPLDQQVRWKVINYEHTYTRLNTGRRSWVPVDNKVLTQFNADVVIVDESHRIGNPTALSSVYCWKLGKKARYRIAMTGTMFHRKPFFVFGQARFLDAGIFGTNFGNFKKRIAVFGGFGGYEVLRYRNLRWMMRQMRKVVYIETHVPEGEPPAITPLFFDLTGSGAAAYKEKEKTAVLTLSDPEEEVVSTLVISRHLRCCMIAGGWIKREDGSYHRVGKDKLEAGRDRFQQYSDEGTLKVVVGCRFVPELQDAAMAARLAGYHVVTLRRQMTPEQRTAAIAAFQRTRKPTALIAQISTGKEGINLSSADTMLFWSLSESYVDHDQFTKRIWQYGEKRVLQYDFLVARGTRDEVNYRAIELKKDVAKFMVENPLVVEKITAQAR